MKRQKVSVDGLRVDRAGKDPITGENVYILSLNDPPEKREKGRPKGDSSYAVSMLYLRLRVDGAPYGAAKAYVKKFFGISDATFNRHWNKHKKYLLFWAARNQAIKEELLELEQETHKK